jgi:hypothetical protein
VGNLVIRYSRRGLSGMRINYCHAHAVTVLDMLFAAQWSADKGMHRDNRSCSNVPALLNKLGRGRSSVFLRREILVQRRPKFINNAIAIVIYVVAVRSGVLDSSLSELVRFYPNPYGLKEIERVSIPSKSKSPSI